MLSRECIMKKAEPWNNACVSFNISKETASRLKQLALRNDEQLKQLGVVSVHVQGEEPVKLSISNNRRSTQEAILGHQPSQSPASGALVSTLGGFGHGNDPREFDTILNQIKASQLHQNLSGYVASEDQTVFVVPQTTKRSNSRKVKEKTLTKSNNNNDMPSTANTLNSAPNGPAISNTSTSNNQELLPSRRDNPSQANMTDSFGDLGDMHHLDFNDLIGADGSLSKHYNEMVTDIFHMDSSMPGPQHNPALGISPTSVNSTQVPSQIGGGNMNNTNLISSNTTDHNTNEVDELLDHIQSIGNEAEQSNGRLNPSVDLSFNQDNNYTNASATPALQRQMSYPQYSSKGVLHGPNTQAMFAGGGKHSTGQINSAVASPLHHNMMGSMGPGSDSAMHIAGNQFASGPMDKNVQGGFPDFNQSYTHCNPDMMGMHKQMISRPPSAGMIQTSGTLNTNWKMPSGQYQHAQLNTMQQSPGLASPKPVNLPPTVTGYNLALTPAKRSYPGLSTVSQMDVQTAPDGSKVQCMSMASPLLVNLLQTSSSTTMAGSGHIINQQLPGTVGEAPRPKKKKQTRRKKITKPSGYNSTTPDQNMIPSPGVMAGQMPAHMSPQHGGARMQQAHFNTQYVMQPVNSPGQYFHPAQSPMPQIQGNMPEGQKGAAMFSHYPNGANITPPGLHPMGKASPGHLFVSDQKTAYIETINRSDVGSRIANNTPMVQQRVPTPGHSPSAHGHITPNHMSSSSVGAGGGMFMGNMSGTVHHGPRMQAMNGMQHPQMQSHMQPSPGMLHNMPSGHQNIRVGGPSPGTPNNSAMNQQFPLQQHHKSGFPFQSPTPTPHTNQTTMYNQQIAPTKQKQPNMMASPSHAPADFMQEAPPPNVVFNGSDSLRQVVTQQRQPMPGYQKRGVMPSEQIIMMQNDGNVQTGTFFHQQGAGNASHIGMKTHNNVSMYHNPNAQIHAAGPNNFNNSNNMDAHNLMMASAHGHGMPGSMNITDATVTHFPLNARLKTGILDSGDISVLLKGTCNSFAYTTRPAHSLSSEAVNQKMSKLSKKSPGSATDGLSSSPGSSHSHTPSPAAMKRCISTSNPPTLLHLDPMGSPTSMTLHHTGAKNSAPRHKSSCPIGTSHRPSFERQSSGSRSQMSTATPSPITVNGPHILSRPASRTEMGQQYMTPPGTPGASRSQFQNPPSYPQVPGSPSPFATIRDGMPTGTGHVHPGAGDMVILPSQSKYQTQSSENNSNRFGTLELVQSPWTNTVANHHPSSRQMNSSFGLSDPVAESGLQNSAAVVTSNSFNLHETSNANQNPSKESAQSNYLNNTLPYGVSPQSTEPTSSPCTPVSDMVQGIHRSVNSPNFFNNQTDDLLSSNKPKKQPENSPAPTVPLQS